jgi:RHH-type transcriptional regulator, rel operon repressor / antitoxin RelB
MLSVRLEPQVEERLEALARATGRTKSFYVREAVIVHLEEMEDRYIAIERLERPGERIPLDELEREIDLEG